MPIAEVNGISVSYDSRGDGTPVLLVCGLGIAAARFELTIRPALDGAGYRTVVFDNRGMAPTSVPEPPYSVDEMASDTIELIEHLELGPAFVYGQSMGALITQTIALQRPDLVRAAVLTIGGGNPSDAMRFRFETLAAALAAGGDVARLVLREFMFDGALPGTHRASLEHITPVIAMFDDMFPAAVDWTGLRGQVGAGLDWASENHLGELEEMSVPCLVVSHGMDVFAPPENLRAVAEAIPDSELVVAPDASHSSLDPATSEITTPAILEFLAAH